MTRPYNPKIRLADHTYGNSEAAKILTKELLALGDRRTIRYVGQKYAFFSFHLNQLEFVHPKTRRHFATLYWKLLKPQIQKRENIPKNIRGLLCNVLHSIYCKWAVDEIYPPGQKD